MEKLVIDQLDDTITIPENLDFECSDRAQLLDQLKVLQMVLKRERERNGGSKREEPRITSPKKIKSPSNMKNLQDLQDKIDKHKQAALQRRANKLKEMDAKAAKVDDKSGSGSVTENKKRILSNNSKDQSPAKKVKNDKIANTQGTSANSSFSSVDSESSSSASSSSQRSDYEMSSRKSYIENFVDVSSDRGKREKVRDQAIAKMRQAGHKISLCPPGEFALKYALSAPYHYFLNRVENSKVTHVQQFTVSFPELLDISLGEIVESLHINFMVEVGWLCLQYLLAAQNPKMTIFCGSVCDPTTKLPDNIKLYEISMPTAYGCHHSKISIFKYKDGGIRIIVSTANIYSDDWENRTQG